MKRNVVFLLFILLFACVHAQQTDKYLTENIQLVRKYLDSVQKLASPNELMLKAALSFLNTPYVAHTLEGNREEELVINPAELDCVTLVENCLALSRAAQYPNPCYEDFVRQLKSIRYRTGFLNGYTSRLHYTSDWITDNSEMRIIDDITHALGGKCFRPSVNFMSTHSELYPALQNNPGNVEMMRSIEQAINQRDGYYFIPKAEIKDKQSLIKSGDIIGFTTAIEGLDISHLGIACWDKERLSFIHASTQYMKVVIEPKSLIDYCREIKTNTGIMVLRPIMVQL